MNHSKLRYQYWSQIKTDRLARLIFRPKETCNKDAHKDTLINMDHAIQERPEQQIGLNSGKNGHSREHVPLGEKVLIETIAERHINRNGHER